MELERAEKRNKRAPAALRHKQAEANKLSAALLLLPEDPLP